MMKKMLTLLLAGSLAVSMLATPVFADEVSDNEVVEEALEDEELDEVEAEEDDEDVIVIDESDLVEITEEEAAEIDNDVVVEDEAAEDDTVAVDEAVSANETVSQDSVEVDNIVNIDGDFTEEINADGTTLYTANYTYRFCKGLVIKLGVPNYASSYGYWYSSNPAVVAVAPTGVATVKTGGSCVLYYMDNLYDELYQINTVVGKNFVPGGEVYSGGFTVKCLQINAKGAKFSFKNESISFSKSVTLKKIRMGSKWYKVNAKEVKIKPGRTKSIKIKKKINLKKFTTPMWGVKFKYKYHW